MTQRPEIAEIRRAARERLTPPECWIQHRVSDNVEFLRGFDLSRPEVLRGTRWSIVGAVYCETEDFGKWDDALSAFGVQARLHVIKAEHPDWTQEQIDEDKTPLQIASFNDSHSHAEVLEVLDRAIEEAE